MRGLWTVVAVCVLGSLAFGQQPSPATRPTGLTESQWKLAAAVVASEGRYEPMLSTELANLAAIQKGKIVKGWASAYTRDEATGAYTFFDGEKTAKKTKESLANDSKARIEAIKDVVRRVKGGESVIPNLVLDGVEVGAAGNLKSPPGTVTDDEYTIQVRVVQVVSETEMLVSYGVFGNYWLTGYSTAGIVDGRILPLKGPHLVSGTKQYQTVNGPRTIFKLEPVSAEGIGEAVAYLRSSPAAAEMPR